MSDIAILKEMIKEEVTVPVLKDNNGKKLVILEEPNLANCSITIYGMPDNDQVIIIQADKFISPNAVFANSKHECKRADFIIIADTDTQKVILCIEMKMKKTTSSNPEIILQLKGAHCFVAYCQEIGKAFWAQPRFLHNYDRRFVSIRDISVPKKQTQIYPENGIHDSPDRMLKINSPHHLKFNRLIGNRE
jgi:hypothetical protein